MLRLGFFLIILSSVAASAAAAETPLFTASSDHPQGRGRNAVRPPQAMVRLALASLDRSDIEMLDSCIAENRIARRNYAALLRAVRIRSGPGRALWFVGPVSRPFCLGLYGAHVFSYFLFEERTAPARPRYRLLFQNRRDFFSVYRRLRHGLNDIEAASCTAGECWTTRLAYNGLRYRPARCTHTLFRFGRERTISRRCEQES